MAESRAESGGKKPEGGGGAKAPVPASSAKSAGSVPAPGGSGGAIPSFKNVWPIPTLAAGGLLLVAGLAVAWTRVPRPPSDVPLEEAKALVQEKRYQEAVEKLGSKEVRKYLDFGNPDEAHMRAFHLARARAFAGAAASRGLERAENHRVIVQDYEAAEKLSSAGGGGAGAQGDAAAHGDAEHASAHGAKKADGHASHADSGHGEDGQKPKGDAHAHGGTDHGAERAGGGGGGAGLDPSDVSILVASLIALDQIDGSTPGGGGAAMQRIAALPASEAARKLRLTRAVVDHDLALIVSGGGEAKPAAAHGSSEERQAPNPDRRVERALDLLGRMASDPAVSAADKAWVLARQGELLLAARQPEEAINKLIRRVGLMKDVPREQQGELYVLLGKAYFQAEQPISAMKQLEAADVFLDKGSPLRADLGIMQGRLAQSGVAVSGVGSAENDATSLLEFAREKFESVMQEVGQAGGGKHYARALMGVAEVEAALRRDDASLEKYAELVARVTGRWKDPVIEQFEGAASRGAGAKGRDLGEVTRERVQTSLMQRYHERHDSGQLESSLRFADMAASLFDEGQVPAEVLLALGTTRRAIGDSLLAQAREAISRENAASGGSRERGRDFSVADLDPATQAEVKRNYIFAGDYLRLHARAVGGADIALSSDSLWKAADSYDRAGDLEEAKKAFADYAQEAADTDPHKPEAKFRLAQVFQAKEPPEYGAAAALYRELVESMEGIPSRNAGSWGDAAIVPLAQCMLLDGDLSNDAEAESLLKSIVDGSRGVSTESEAFREALIELGQATYRLERFAEAIEWLEQSVKRSRLDPLVRDGRGAERMGHVRYLLADSHRREGVKIGKTLATQKLPQSDVEKLQQLRVEHLTSARAIYNSVRADLEAKEASGKALTGMEAIALRNSYFYEGDCSMELRAFDAAIASYDAARNKYASDPSCLVAMAQIVSAYAAQEKWAEARTANERARQQLAKFPESVWQNPNLPMEKRHWERWLDARTLIGQRASGDSE